MAPAEIVRQYNVFSSRPFELEQNTLKNKKEREQ